MRKRNTVNGILLPALFCLFAASLRADFPAATYSLACDGDVTTASSFLGGSVLSIHSATYPASYVSVRDSPVNKAFVVTDAAKPMGANTSLDIFGSGSWSMLVVARGAEIANGVYWDVGKPAWDSNSNGNAGFSLIRTASGGVALVRRAKSSSPQTILSASVDNDTTKFHSFLVTYDAGAAGTEASPYFALYVDGAMVAFSATLYQAARNGCQFGAVYGGSPAANLSDGLQFAIDEIGVWQTRLTAEQAAEVCAHYPVWPNVTRHQAMLSSDAAFSELGWTPAWVDASTTIADITVTARATLSIDTALRAYGIEVASAYDFGFVLGENGSLGNVESINLTAVTGKIILDATTFPLAEQLLYGNTATVRVESVDAVLPPTSASGLLGLLNKPGQTLEIAAPVTAPTVSGKPFLGFGASDGSMTVCLDEGTEITVSTLVLGSYNSANVALTQRGGAVVLTGSAPVLSIARNPLSESSYTILGGTFTAPAAKVTLGESQMQNNARAARLTVGGGTNDSVFSVQGIVANDRSTAARTVTLAENGTLVLGSGGIDLDSPGGSVTLAGGVMRSTASAALYAGAGVTVTGDITIDVASGTMLTLPAITGTGNITKTGDGTLFFSGASPNFGGTISVESGAIGVSESGATGTGALTFASGTQFMAVIPASLLATGGVVTIDRPVLSQVSALPAIAAVARNGNTVLDAGTDYTLADDGQVLEFTFPVRVEGHAAWFDFTFSRESLSTRVTSSRNIRNDGYAGATEYLLFDGTWRGTNGYDMATGRLLMKTTPCRDMTGAFAWPDAWTVALASHLPNEENACIVSVGSTYYGTCNYLALARGGSDSEVILAYGHGHAAAQTLATMEVPEAGDNVIHLFILAYDGETCTVYHAFEPGGRVSQIGSCTLTGFVPGGGIQIGSIHGGVAGTGLVRVDDLPDPDSYEVRALRIFETVLNAECRQMLGDELAKIKGTVFIFR